MTEVVEVYKILEEALGKEKADVIMNYVKQVVNGIKSGLKSELKDELVTKDVFQAEMRNVYTELNNLKELFYAEIKTIKTELLLEIEKLKSENRVLKQLIYFLIIINILAMTIFNRDFIETIKLLFKVGG